MSEQYPAPSGPPPARGGPQGPPTQGPPTQGPPTQGPPMQGPPMQGPPMQGPPMQAQPGPSAPKKGPGGKMILRIGLVVVVALVVAGIAWFLTRSEPSNAKVGDCISGQTAEEMKIVDCADASATNKVVGRVEGRTAAEFDADLAGICQAYPTAESGFWRGEEGEGKKGLVLCLEPITR